MSIFEKTNHRGAASGVVFFLFLHVTIFTLCCDATSYVYASEIFPTPVRAKGLSISVSGLFFATIIFTTAAPTAFANIGWKFYLVFIGLTSIIIVYAYFTFPEVCCGDLCFGDNSSSGIRHLKCLLKIFKSSLVIQLMLYRQNLLLKRVLTILLKIKRKALILKRVLFKLRYYSYKLMDYNLYIQSIKFHVFNL